MIKKEILFLNEVRDIMINVPSCKISTLYVSDIHYGYKHVHVFSGLSRLAEYLNKPIVVKNDGTDIYPYSHNLTSDNGFEYQQLTQDGVLD